MLVLAVMVLTAMFLGVVFMGVAGFASAIGKEPRVPLLVAATSLYLALLGGMVGFVITGLRTICG